jgi:hypothetical protein
MANRLSALLREHETFESRPGFCHRWGAAKWIIADAIEGDLVISGRGCNLGYREGWQSIVSCGLDDLVGPGDDFPCGIEGNPGCGSRPFRVAVGPSRASDRSDGGGSFCRHDAARLAGSQKQGGNAS